MFRLSLNMISTAALLASVLTPTKLLSATEDPASTIDTRTRQVIETRLAGVPISSISKTPVDGLYEIVSEGSIYYIDQTAEHLFDGSLIEISTRSNITSTRLGYLHSEVISQIDESQVLAFNPEDPINRTMTVFTDISCAYCRKFHSEIDDLLDEGIQVRYLLFPRAGLGSQAYKDLESVWCADDQQAAMTYAKAGNKVESRSCENPIEAHMALAEQVGLTGTPLIYLDNGQRIAGYQEADDLVDMILESKPL